MSIKKKNDKAQAEKKQEEIRRQIVETYVDLVKNANMIPTRYDLATKGITRDKLRHHFTNLSVLRKEAKTFFPEAFGGVLDIEEMLSEENIEKLRAKIGSYSRVFLTTAVVGQRMHQNFITSAQTLCKELNALLLILPSHDPAHNLDNQIEWHFDDPLVKNDFVFCGVDLNSNIHISDLRVTAKQINPTTGLGRICQGKGSFIFGSPKQSLEFDPVSNTKMPHARMSTGACTIANYNTTRGNSLRTAWLAENDHEIGGIIVEIADNKTYHFRQVQAAADGSFADLGVLYNGKKTSKIVPKFVMGDLHAGEHDETAVAAWMEIINKLGCDEIFFHDGFNGASISHHEDDNIIIRAQKAQSGRLSLDNEIQITGDLLNRILSPKCVKKGIMIKSNHDEWLADWLQRAKFKDDPLNFQTGCELAAIAVDGHDPLRSAIEDHCYSAKQHLHKLIWLERDQNYKIGGVECGAHGDVGANGSRGSKIAMERSYGKCVIGHSHTPGKLRKVFQVGTTSKRRLSYTKGASSWMHCSALVYPNGQVQLINSINGKWGIEDGR